MKDVSLTVFGLIFVCVFVLATWMIVFSVGKYAGTVCTIQYLTPITEKIDLKPLIQKSMAQQELTEFANQQRKMDKARKIREYWKY